jgi:3-deoxy-D-manno-octulosonic-acid transferase
LEPAILHKPILTGPILHNFIEISELLLREDAMVMVKNAEEIAQEVTRLFSDESSRKRFGENAYNVVAKNRGALDRQVALVRQILK